MSTNDLTALAVAVGVLTDPASPEGIGTTLTYSPAHSSAPAPTSPTSTGGGSHEPV